MRDPVSSHRAGEEDASLPTDTDGVERRRRMLVGVATLALVFALQGIVTVAFEGPGALRGQVIRLVVLVLDGAVLAGASVRFRHTPLPRLVAVSAALVSAINMASTLVTNLLERQQPHSIYAASAFPKGPPPLAQQILLAAVAAPGVIVGVWTLTYLYPLAQARLRAQSRQARMLRRDVELARLRSSLEPHFVLNTLTVIAGVVGDDPDEARRLLGALGDLFRDLLRPHDVHTMGQELAWLRGYVLLLEARYRGQIEVTWDVCPQAEPTPVPRLLLQPLVENAVVHGALQRADGGGRVSIRIDEVKDPNDRSRVRCVVADNGPGFDVERVREGSLGLQLVRDRLRIFGAGDTLLVVSSPDGVRVQLEVPMVAP
jgi:signal transduction histidine kinase